MESSTAKATASRATSSTNMMVSCPTISRRRGIDPRGAWATYSMWFLTSSTPPVHPPWSHHQVSVRVKVTFHRAPPHSRSTPLFWCPKAPCFHHSQCCLQRACHNCLPKWTSHLIYLQCPNNISNSSNSNTRSACLHRRPIAPIFSTWNLVPVISSMVTHHPSSIITTIF